MRGPAGRTVVVYDGKSFLGGIAANGGRSLALLPGWPTTSKMLVYGGDEAAEELQDFIESWVERGRPGPSDVQLTASFRNGTSSMRVRWNGR